MISLLLILVSDISIASSSHPDWKEGYTLIILKSETVEEMNIARDYILQQGGRVSVLIPTHAILGWIPEGISGDLIGKYGIESIHRQEVLPQAISYRDDATLQAVEFFNGVIKVEPEPAMITGRPLIDDTREAPPASYQDYLDNLRNIGMDIQELEDKGLLLYQTPQGRLQGTSEALRGSAVLTVLFVESDGSIESDLYTWTSSAESFILNELLEALSWWSAESNQYGCPVTFTLDYYSGTDSRCQQGYEPLNGNHSSWDEELWIDLVMNNFGYTSGGVFDKVDAFNTWQRDYFGTDWSYSAFVHYNPYPAPTTYNDGYFAWAFLGGPWTHMLYRNDGWGLSAFSDVLAHETGHIFWACDEYYQPGYGGCMSCDICVTWGPRSFLNVNCEYCNPEPVECLMKEGVVTAGLCFYTPGQIGWYESPCTAPFFNMPGEEYQLGNTPRWLSIADVDSDGDQDLISAIAGDDEIAILKNEGDAIFQEPAYYQVGDNPISFSAVDFNGDEKIDLAVANYSGSTVSILINNGDGTFQDKVDYWVSSTPNAIFSADLDQDNDLDLVAPNRNLDKITILRNNGDGTFQSAIWLNVGDKPSGDLAADLDADSDSDLAVANQGTDDVSILLNNGDGTFQPAVSYSAGSGAYSIFGSDLDGDTDLDLAIGNTYADSICILKNNGDGTFGSPSNHWIGDTPSFIFASDLDEDEDSDLLVAGFYDGDVSVMLNNGDATFQRTILYGMSDQIDHLFGGDLDGDSDVDLVVANSSYHRITILLNLTLSGDYPPILAPIGDKSTYEGEKLEFRISARDRDGIIPRLFCEPLPTNAALVESLNGAGSFTFTPDLTQADVYSIVFLAFSESVFDSERVEITVTNYPGGDANHDDVIDIVDVVYLINYLFRDGPTPYVLSAMDVNCDDEVTIPDAVYLINYILRDGPEPCHP
jgi:hypothetical protein